jgi:hypothetical protein
MPKNDNESLGAQSPKPNSKFKSLQIMLSNLINFFLFASIIFVVICSLYSTSNSKEGIRFRAFKFRFRPASFMIELVAIHRLMYLGSIHLLKSPTSNIFLIFVEVDAIEQVIVRFRIQIAAVYTLGRLQLRRWVRTWGSD